MEPQDLQQSTGTLAPNSYMPVGEFENGSYEVIVDPDGSVEVLGNRQGLLYLADVLVRCAIGGFTPGLHVHLQMRGMAKGPNLNASSELTIFACGSGGAVRPCWTPRAAAGAPRRLARFRVTMWP